MKKLLNLAIISVFILFNSCNKNENFLSDNDSPDSSHRIKRELIYSTSSSKQLQNEKEYLYDELGNLSQLNLYFHNSSKTLAGYTKYVYDGNKKIREFIYSGNAGQFEVGIYAVYYYTNDNLTKEEWYLGKNNSLNYTTYYEYDDRNNLTRKYTDDPAHGIRGDVKYTYNANNQLVIVENTETSLNYTKTTKHIYDNAGRKAKTENYNPQGNLLHYSVFSYKGNNLQPEEEIQRNHSGEKMEKRSHFYDKQGRLTKSVVNDQCILFERKYVNGLMVEQKFYDQVWGCQESAFITYEYEKK